MCQKWRVGRRKEGTREEGELIQVGNFCNIGR